MTDPFRDFCDIMAAHIKAEKRAAGLTDVGVAMLVLRTSDEIAASGLPAVTHSGLIAVNIAEADLIQRFERALEGLRARTFRQVERGHS